MLRTLLVSLVALAACAEEPLDDVRWACDSDRDCGADGRCVNGLCATGEAAPSGGLACEAPARAMTEARFALDAEAGGRVLVFEAGGRQASFALPEDVVALEAHPVERCCESPCCALIPR